MIRAIVFDYGNVIDAVDMSRFVQAIASSTRLSVPAVQEIMQHTSPLARQYESGAITSDEFYEGLVRSHNLSVSREQFFNAFDDIFDPISSTYELIRNLKPAYRLGLLSNTNARHYDHRVKLCPVFPLFDAVTVSFQVKMMKPAEAIYCDILRKLSVRPEESIFVDDLPENIAAARQIGMQTILYRSHESLISSLEALQVRCS